MKKLLCWLGGHDYYEIERYSPTMRKLGCRRCPGKWGMQDQARTVIEWDADLEELAQMYRRSS